jgi:hypothetical protein
MHLNLTIAVCVNRLRLRGELDAAFFLLHLPNRETQRRDQRTATTAPTETILQINDALGELFGDFDSVADGIGKRIAEGILGRIQSFPEREAHLGRQGGKMDSLPEDILWEGLGEESAPVFVVYKLIHEAYSNVPQFFRSALVEFLRAQVKDARHESIPLDLLYTTLDDDHLHVRILVRAKANPSDRADIRRRSLYLRSFLRKAFAGYQLDQLDITLAFYLDHEHAHIAWHGSDSLFHPEEWITRTHFWNDLCPGANPEELFATIRKSATTELTTKKVVEQLKAHFARTTKDGKPKQP